MDETMKRKRNSVLYQAAGADAMLGIGGRSLDPGTSDAPALHSLKRVTDVVAIGDDSASEVSEMEDYESETHSQAPSVSNHQSVHSAPSSEDHSHSSPNSPTTPRADRYPSASAVRKAKAAARDLGLGQNGHTPTQSHGQGQGQEEGGLPSSQVPMVVGGIAR
jgi:RalA-binding protein 1